MSFMTNWGSCHPQPSASYSTFRNVSACNRCRLRKNRCDQRLPRCQSCEKAGVHCVGYDVTLKREIPRSYVFFLESRVSYLEKLLANNRIEFRPPTAYEGEEEAEAVKNDTRETKANSRPGNDVSLSSRVKRERTDDNEDSSESQQQPVRLQGDGWGIDDMASNLGVVSIQGTSDSRYLGSASGISFARLVFAAVRSSVPDGGSTERIATQSVTEPFRQSGSRIGVLPNRSSMRDSVFSFQSRPTMKQAPFPDSEVAERLVDLYFEHANPQIPILHRNEFMGLFDRVYRCAPDERSQRDLYSLNIVCAIGAGIIYDTRPDSHDDQRQPNSSTQKRQRLSGQQSQPEEYYASAIIHLESCPGAIPGGDGHSGLEELQAVLLLASFALLRPVPPGLWYIIGVAVRSAIDLGLHYEGGTGIDTMIEQEGLVRSIKDANAHGKQRVSEEQRRVDPQERGRREWIRDLRRRLWWCVYAFDRLVSTCVGRPFGISDDVITTEFPSELDDSFITKSGILEPTSPNTPSYKRSALHYVKLRLLQSEIQQVLQHQQACHTRKIAKIRGNRYMHTNLPCAFLQKFETFGSWRKDVERRLLEWKESAPSSEAIGVRFPVEFLELNYWQSVVMLYRQNLVAPEPLTREIHSPVDISSPSIAEIEDDEDEDDICMKVAEAGRMVLRIYRKMHRVRLVNYTYLSTHHLFMAGISFLYAIWHSPAVRNNLTLEELDFTILAGTSVLGDLAQKCPPAEACREAFQRMSEVTVRMCWNGNIPRDSRRNQPPAYQDQMVFPGEDPPRPPVRIRRQSTTSSQPTRKIAPRHAFDMNFESLFPKSPSPRQHSPLQIRSNTPSIQQTISNIVNAPPIFTTEGLTPGPVPMDQQQTQQQQQQGSTYQSSIVPDDGSQGYTKSPISNTEFEYLSTYTRYPNFTTVGPGAQMTTSFDPILSTLPDSDPYNSSATDNFNIYPFQAGNSQGTAAALDLGFGFALDYQHDWNDGGGMIDLFDGYFFGSIHNNSNLSSGQPDDGNVNSE